MNSKSFLVVGGIILVLLGILGFIGVIGPTADKSIFHSAWYFDNGENWAHLVLGVVGLIGAFALPAMGQKYLAFLFGIVGVLVGIYSIFNQKFLGANLENPADTLLHLIVGVWALISAMGTKPTDSMGPNSAAPMV